MPYDPRLVGQEPPRIVLGKGSGLDSITEHVARHGLSATEAQASTLLQEVKAASLDKHGLLTDDEFAALARRVLDVS